LPILQYGVERGSSLEQNEEIQIWEKTSELSFYPSIPKLNLHLFLNECWKLLYNNATEIHEIQAETFWGFMLQIKR
jgi:hypothetical protein